MSRLVLTGAEGRGAPRVSDQQADRCDEHRGTTVNDASALIAIDCPTANECVAVDTAGDEFTGRG